jgi:predicted Zn-dependent protease
MIRGFWVFFRVRVVIRRGVDMKRLIAALLLVPAALASNLAAGQALLDLGTDFDYSRAVVEAAAERAYRARVTDLASKGNLDADGALLTRLRALTGRLATATAVVSPDRTVDWEVHTCRRCGENASAMAGGRLLVGEEFIAGLAPGESELAFLLAHEMAHVLAEHTREYASAARYFVDNGRNRKYEDVQHELDESFVVSRRMAALYAREELEADYIGLMVGSRAGFDPAAMLSLLAKLDTGNDAAFPLHPGGNERIEHARGMLQTAYRIREMAAANAGGS